MSATIQGFAKCTRMRVLNYRPFLFTTLFFDSTAGFNLFLRLLTVSDDKVDGETSGKSVCDGSRVTIPKLLLWAFDSILALRAFLAIVVDQSYFQEYDEIMKQCSHLFSSPS